MGMILELAAWFIGMAIVFRIYFWVKQLFGFKI